MIRKLAPRNFLEGKHSLKKIYMGRKTGWAGQKIKAGIKKAK